MKLSILAFLFFAFSISCFSQTNYPTRDSVHIFWQPNQKITFKDYKGDTTHESMDCMREYNFSASAFTGFWSVLDIPKKERERGKKLEKVYFAPAFDMTTSFALTNDSLQIEMQNTFFDICEIWARFARRELKNYQEKMGGAYGSLSIMYMTVKEDMDGNRLSMIEEYYQNVFVKKEEGAYEKWRKFIDKVLEDSKDWATTPEECYRFIKGEPIEKGYIMAPKLVGPLHNKKNNVPNE